MESRALVSRLIYSNVTVAAGLLTLFTSPAHGQLSTSDSSVGYIDNAIPSHQIRLRFDAAFNNDFPDRAEFFYGKCGCFRVLGIDPSAPGPPEIETGVDYQDLMAYLEYGMNHRFSVFAELPVRFLNPDNNDNTAGYADMNAGFKYALRAGPDEYLTFQLRTYIPTGDADSGLGNHHVSLEPALLYFRRLSDRITLEGEFRDWIPIDGTENHAGNILRYGLGLGVTVHESRNLSVTPVAEFVGWTVLDGQKFDGRKLLLLDADGDTIVNFKIGLRLGFDHDGLSLGDRSSLYAGYGRALTGDVWYEDVFRLEYRVAF